MYERIFGFQRFVWCPKWTPASSRSFIETGGSPGARTALAMASVVVLICPISSASPSRARPEPLGGSRGSVLREACVISDPCGPGRFRRGGYSTPLGRAARTPGGARRLQLDPPRVSTLAQIGPIASTIVAPLDRVRVRL